MITQQQECYAAERALDDGRRFDSVEAAQQWVDSLRDERWWAMQRYSTAVLRIEVGAAAKNKTHSVGWYDADKSAGRIELTQHGLCTRVILHDVAHVLAMAAHKSKSHDPWWARTYLTLVSYVMGTDAYLTLQKSFDEQGVDYHVDLALAGVIAL